MTSVENIIYHIENLMICQSKYCIIYLFLLIFYSCAENIAIDEEDELSEENLPVMTYDYIGGEGWCSYKVTIINDSVIIKSSIKSANMAFPLEPWQKKNLLQLYSVINPATIPYIFQPAILDAPGRSLSVNSEYIFCDISTFGGYPCAIETLCRYISNLSPIDHESL